MHYGNGIALSERALDLLWLRQNITTNNIANVDTPGYKMKNVSFENEFKTKFAGKTKASAITKAIGSTYGSVKRIDGESTRLDGNNVDMDIEQVELARTAIQYQYTINSINNDFSRLRQAVKAF